MRDTLRYNGANKQYGMERVIMKLAIDAMGGDNAPAAVLDGVLAFLNEPEAEGVNLKLFGDEAVLKAFSAAHPELAGRVETAFTTETIGMGEHPTEAIRKKKDSSLVKALECVRDKEADCFFSAGSGLLLFRGKHRRGADRRDADRAAA